MSNYATLTVARNEEDIIAGTIDRLLKQEYRPNIIVLVNDGSTDQTGSIMDEYMKKFDFIKVIHRKNRGFSGLGTYLMSKVYNDGFKILFENDEWTYVMIAAADSRFPVDYAKRLLSYAKPNYGVFGGLPENEKRARGYCPGSGRFIKREILENMGGQYPSSNNWESSVFSEAWMLGYRTGHIPSIRFQRTRKGGSGHRINYYGWGRGMRDGGYHPFHVLIRTIFDFLRGRYIQAIKMFVGYCAHTPTGNYKRNKFLKQYQKKHIIHSIRKRLRLN